MHILLTGATGFIGKALAELLYAHDHNLIVVSRDVEKAAKLLPFAKSISWDPADLRQALSETDVVINLAGESIASGKWNKKKKTSIVNSRMLAAQRLVDAMQNLKKKPGLFMQASAIGIYGNRGEEVCTELSSHGSGFLADVCVKWESHMPALKEMIDRTLILRIGVVLGEGGGMLPELIKLNKKHLAGKLGNGRQWISWIHIYDLLHAILYLMDNDEANGPYNLTAPNASPQINFSRTLATKTGNKMQLPAPAFMIKLAMGEMGKELLLSGQKVLPGKLIKEGFVFKYNLVEEAIEI